MCLNESLERTVIGSLHFIGEAACRQLLHFQVITQTIAAFAFSRTRLITAIAVPKIVFGFAFHRLLYQKKVMCQRRRNRQQNVSIKVDTKHRISRIQYLVWNGEVAMQILRYVSTVIGVVGIMIICWGVLLSIISFALIEYDHVRGLNIRNRRYLLRHHLGTYLLAGLEFLIAADIVRTIMEPTFTELAILGAIIAIRTAISYFLNMEMKHPHYRTEGES